ncbi:type I-E CRISPR-associated protein Cas6/Cse3/CasE [Streptomyces sp. NPDC089919]|uniref:type I-E CRISPR-associated protein Cas6/Cse3/CasE n=1 Tax=Streptomyces sp. NPDC089919 TaxID=3155188 RepID=UPI003412A63F
MPAWLTRIIPDPRAHEVRRDHGSATGMHRRIMSLFPEHAGPDPRARFHVLYRTEDSPTGSQLLIQSSERPDLAKLPAGYGQSASKPLDALLDALRPGLTVQYRCVASPVRKPGRTTRALYDLPAAVPLSGAAADEWWVRQAAAAGLQPQTVSSRPLDTALVQRAASGPGTPQRFQHARTQFDGTATIVDADELRTKLLDGIGRGKAYGCGLLTIAPPRR